MVNLVVVVCREMEDVVVVSLVVAAKAKVQEVVWGQGEDVVAPQLLLKEEAATTTAKTQEGARIGMADMNIKSRPTGHLVRLRLFITGCRQIVGHPPSNIFSACIYWYGKNWVVIMNNIQLVY